jgi:hypothetical protein
LVIGERVKYGEYVKKVESGRSKKEKKNKIKIENGEIKNRNYRLSVEYVVIMRLTKRITKDKKR